MKIPTPISISAYGYLIIYTPWGKSIKTRLNFKDTWVEKIICSWLDWRFDFNKKYE